jgi:hypothetical protein
MEIPEVTDLDMSFGGAKKFLPPFAKLPVEFQSMRGPFCDAVSMLFFKGGKLSDHGMKPKAGVDEKKVYRVLRACLSDFSPSHEHKIGGTGYLLSQWYDHDAKAKKAA